MRNLEPAWCSVHDQPAQYSTCGDYWFCSGYYDDEEDRECVVKDSDTADDPWADEALD